MRKIFFYLLLLPIMASAAEISTSRGDKAIQGYDSVGYYGEGGTATKGDKAWVFEWRGAKWHFADADSRDLFASDPEKYAPQYGGHCANAMSLNKKVKSNAKIWLIHDGRLYLFAGKKGRKRWQAPENDIAELIKQADSHWLTLKDK